jgi:hypothetical protein
MRTGYIRADHIRTDFVLVTFGAIVPNKLTHPSILKRGQNEKSRGLRAENTLSEGDRLNAGSQ